MPHLKGNEQFQLLMVYMGVIWNNHFTKTFAKVLQCFVRALTQRFELFIRCNGFATCLQISRRRRKFGTESGRDGGGEGGVVEETHQLPTEVAARDQLGKAGRAQVQEVWVCRPGLGI